MIHARVCPECDCISDREGVTTHMLRCSRNPINALTVLGQQIGENEYTFRQGQQAMAQSPEPLWQENQQLRERVKELEAKQETSDRALRSYAEANRVPCRGCEDLARKREECGRLEAQLGDLGRENLRLRHNLDAADRENGELRRELRGKR